MNINTNLLVVERFKACLSSALLAAVSCFSILISPFYAATGYAESESVAPDTAKEWLMNMAHTMENSSYRGRYVYFDGSKLRSVSLQYANLNSVPYERITHLDGMHSEILRVGQEIICLHEGKEIGRFTQPSALSTSSPRGFSSPALLDHYDAKLGESTRVAGKEAVHISLTPKDQYRYGYQIWVDRNNFLLLKSVLSTEEDDMEVFEFTNLALSDDLKVKDFVVDGISISNVNQNGVLTPKIKTHLKESEKSSEEKKPVPFEWTVGWMPKGFMHYKMLNQARLDKPVNSIDMRSFSDGLSSFTLFISNVTDLDLASKEQMIMKHGATYIASQVQKKKFRVTFVGELPLLAARRVVSSVSIDDK